MILKSLYSNDKNYAQLSEKKKKFHASYIHGILHAIVSASLSLYCLVYADGQPNTTWIHCNFYKLNMFDL